MATLRSKRLVCDHCGRNINRTKIRTTRVGEVEAMWFICPRCGEPYIASATDKQMRQDRRRYAQLQGMIKTEREKLAAVMTPEGALPPEEAARAEQVERLIQDATALQMRLVNRSMYLRSEFPKDKLKRRKIWP